ncbi:hypothetical protein [Bdellovibrio reynosensis]|uniref:Uncharacterized protein n=1 Tax=Bdellovibrio reynosensis TaxID=2835041 RepID=A0ABY4CGC4_9BACT|nr:hypothetical protein [Bdellovibrio reynosensis]UOF02846.1 hypothetical protein MNR06_07755 [Bdellovibrio reynosensis]
MKVFVVILAALFCLSAQASIVAETSEVLAKKSSKKSEPAPKEDERGGEEYDPRQGTYEGNDRGGGSFDGGGYDGGSDEGGMIGEIFFVRNSKTYPITTNTKTEDRGDVVVYTTTVQEDISANESCTTVTVVVIEKATNSIVSSDSNYFCNSYPL